MRLERTDTKPAGRVKHNLSLLKDQQTHAPFTRTLKNRFQVLQEMIIEDSDAHDIWYGTKDAITEICKETLGPNKQKHKDWISVDKFQKIQVRRDKTELVNSSRKGASNAALTQSTHKHTRM